MADAASTRRVLKEKLLQQVQAMDLHQALFPANGAEIDDRIRQLEGLTPISHPLQPAYLPTLTGTWELLYASRGTALTRQLDTLSQNSWPGLQVERIWQELTVAGETRITAENRARLSLPWLGHWQVRAQGEWVWDLKDAGAAKVRFQAFGLQAIDLWGQKGWHLPELRVPVLEFLRNEALWITSYLDEDLRVGRGATGNLFVFRRNL